MLSRLQLPIRLLTAAAVFVPTHLSAEDGLSLQVERLVQQLDHELFVQREAASRQLFDFGDPVIPLLRDAAAEAQSAEVRFRARAVIRRLQEQTLVRGFTAIGKIENDEEIDLEHGMWLISRIVDPAVEKEPLVRQFDQLAEKVRQRLGPDTDITKLSPAGATAAINRVLFDELGFDGARQDYDNPVNSSLESVLRTRKGLPIMLSHVVVSVAERLDVPIVGIGISGRYMCKYDGSRAPEGRSEDIIIDPFGGGELMTANVLRQRHSVFEGDLEPHPRRATLQRMMTNLANDYDHIGKHADAARVRRLKQLIGE